MVEEKQSFPTMVSEQMDTHMVRRIPGFLASSGVKNPPANAGELSSIPGSGRSPGGRNENPLQYSCLGNPMDRETWQATVHGIAKVLKSS